jgi:addiction module HigA family antidote
MCPAGADFAGTASRRTLAAMSGTGINEIGSESIRAVPPAATRQLAAGGLAMTMKNPPHPGLSVRHDCIEALDLTITEAAKILGVTRQTLNNLVNGKSGISADMEIRLDKAFGGGAELHLVFNHRREIVALKLTPGNVSDTVPVPGLTKDLIGKLFGDKGYIGKKLAEELLRRGLALMTRVRGNMKSLPVSFFDKALLNGRNMAETIIGHIKEFSSLRLPKHRFAFNAFTHIAAAIVAYQIDPLPPQQIRVILPA